MSVNQLFCFHSVSSDNLASQVDGELEQPRILSEQKQEFAQAFDLMVSVLQTEISRILVRIHSVCEAM